MQQQQPNPYEANINCPRVSVADFLAESHEWEHDEYVRVIPDRDDGVLRLYRLTGKHGSDDFVMTVVSVESFDFREIDRRSDNPSHDNGREPLVFHLHTYDAGTFLTWLESFGRAGEEPDVHVRWTADNGKPMFGDTPTTEESLTFAYGPSLSRPDRAVHISNAWQSDTHRIARFDG